jgi:hypothetical protein
MINEKQSRALLKNTFDPLLSQLTKVNKITIGQPSSALGSVMMKFEVDEQVAVYEKGLRQLWAGCCMRGIKATCSC